MRNWRRNIESLAGSDGLSEHVSALCFLSYHSKFSMLWPGDNRGSHDSPRGPKHVICAMRTGLWWTKGIMSVLDMPLSVQATDAQAKMGQGGTVRMCNIPAADCLQSTPGAQICSRIAGENLQCSGPPVQP